MHAPQPLDRAQQVVGAITASQHAVKRVLNHRAVRYRVRKGKTDLDRSQAQGIEPTYQAVGHLEIGVSAGQVGDHGRSLLPGKLAEGGV